MKTLPSRSSMYEPAPRAIAIGSRRGYVRAFDSRSAWRSSSRADAGPGIGRHDPRLRCIDHAAPPTARVELVDARHLRHRDEDLALAGTAGERAATSMLSTAIRSPASHGNSTHSSS